MFYNTIKDLKTLFTIREKKIGFTCSTFDLLHAGHHIMLEDSKRQCDILVVGLHTDPTMNVEYREVNQTIQEKQKTNLYKHSMKGLYKLNLVDM